MTNFSDREKKGENAKDKNGGWGVGGEKSICVGPGRFSARAD